uniref:Translocator protein n=1 Tax=Timema douglasi TaxID=61478 RepID=A0A7R8ZGR5_TIMDO|nr:unnamed protein product [Timema douglasi]
MLCLCGKHTWDGPLLNGATSLAEISVLWVNVAACVYTFHQVNQIAGYILLPYLAWLSVASALNYVIWRDNPEKKEK